MFNCVFLKILALLHNAKTRLHLMINHLTVTPMTNLILDKSYCSLSHIVSRYYLV